MTIGSRRPVEKLRKYIPPQSPSEVWGRRDTAPETFIGIRLKDQNGDPVIGSRVRVKLPDGKTKEGKTDSDGELQITGFTVDGPADITLLDFAKPGAAKPIDPDPPKEFKIVVVDETGKKGVADVAMVFDDGATPETVKTDSSGTATFKTSTADIVSVNFESRDSLANAIKPMWKSRPPTKPEDYAKPGGDVSAVELRPATIDVAESKGDLFKGLTLEPDARQTISVRPPPRQAVVLHFHDALFRTASAVVLPEGEAPSSKTGEHESLTSVGIVATLLRCNEENPGKKLFIAGHTDKADTDAHNQVLSEQRAKAVLALIEGKKGDYIKACHEKHSEIDVTQLFDWVHGAPFNFKCKPTTLTAAPSDNNYVLFRESFNDWIRAGNKGTPINKYGRLTDDIWGAMFDLYEYNLEEELGEDPAGLRGKLAWVDDGKKAIGFGEKHPVDPGEGAGTANQTDRRVEALMFDDDEETLPKLAETEGEDVYDGRTYKRVLVNAYDDLIEPVTAIYLLDRDGYLLPAALCRILDGPMMGTTMTADSDGAVYLPSDSSTRGPFGLEWSHPTVPNDYVYSCTVTLGTSPAEATEARTREILRNLGYLESAALEPALKKFQRDYQVDASPIPVGLANGQVPAATLNRLEETQIDPKNAKKP